MQTNTQSFDDLPLNAALKKAVADLGYTQPSPIQAQALPILLGPATDFIGLAATGTGKTAAFSLPLLEKIDPKVKQVQAIILCPTRELCNQVSGQVKLLGRHLGVDALAIYGGAGYDEQLRGLKRGVPVVVGTPGRVIDHLERGTLKLDGVQLVVLDEADEMISMGFRDDMELILSKIPPAQSNTWLFSATMSGPVRKVANKFLKDPKTVQVNQVEMLSSTVEQIYYMTQEKNKPEVLCKLIDAADDFYGVVFAQTKSLVVDIQRYLTERGYRVDSLHGDLGQTARDAAMKSFRDRRVKILVCTDVASRGLDVKDMTHVINFSIPRELDSYVHRIGRTARSGKAGMAMSLVTPSHRHLIQKIERMTRSRLTEGQVPNRRTIGQKKISQMTEQFNTAAHFQRAKELMDDTWKKSLEGMSAEEVAARFLSMMFPYVFAEREQPGRMERADAPVGSQQRGDARRDDRRDDRRPDRRGDRRSAPRRANDSKDERRDDKRREKRDDHKKYKMRYAKRPKGPGSQDSHRK